VSTAPPSSRPLILIVDDFDDALEIYSLSLAHKGYRVMTAASGAEAIDKTLTYRPALILMDLRMPEMSGTEAMAAIRQHPPFVPIPIIAFTAHALEGERRAALAAGFDDFIAKPCLPDELMTAIDRFFSRAQPPRPGEIPAANAEVRGSNRFRGATYGGRITTQRSQHWDTDARRCDGAIGLAVVGAKVRRRVC